MWGMRDFSIKDKKCVILSKRVTQILGVSDALSQSEEGALEQGASRWRPPSVTLVSKGYHHSEYGASPCDASRRSLVGSRDARCSKNVFSCLHKMVLTSKILCLQFLRFSPKPEKPWSILRCSTSNRSKLSFKPCTSQLVSPCPIPQNSLRPSSTAQKNSENREQKQSLFGLCRGASCVR